MLSVVAKAFFKHQGYSFEGDTTWNIVEHLAMVKKDFSEKTAMIAVRPLSKLNHKSFSEFMNRVVSELIYVRNARFKK